MVRVEARFTEPLLLYCKWINTNNETKIYQDCTAKVTGGS